MTITNYFFTSDYERCSSLAFGVPLEDCFPSDDIHPFLKELFLNAHENIVSCGYPIDEIISKLQGSIGERLSIKESVVLCKPMSGVVSPGALLWVIRHFVGLIPVPLLSRYTDSKTFNWIGLSQFCKQALLRPSQIGGGDKLLVWKIAQELLRLPFPNLLLFSVLVKFIRALTSSKQNVKKLAVVSLIRYFCGSIFVRPYVPDYNGKVERVYTPFFFFVVLKWPKIEKVFKGKAQALPKDDFSRNCINPNSASSPRLVSFLDYQLHQTRPALYTSKSTCTQTNDFEYDISTISEESLETDILKDVGFQTDSFLWEKRKQQGRCKCCCRYGRNYETHDNERKKGFTQDNEVQTGFYLESEVVDSLIETAVPYYYDVAPNINNLAKEDIQKTTFVKQEGENSNFETEGVYFDDNYSNSNLDLFSSEGEKVKYDPKILARVSKFGWSYTPRTSISGESSGLLTPLKIALKEDNYSLFFNEKEVEKDVCSLSSQICTDEELLEKSTYGTSKKSKMNIGLGKFRSGLDLLRFFSRRKVKVANTSSLDEVSKIKYKKMNSSKSTTF